jgi:uncharacterized protein YidB (DUF937 family)
MHYNPCVYEKGVYNTSAVGSTRGVCSVSSLYQEFIMSLLSNLVSGAVGATLASVAKDYIAKQGGLKSLVAQFEQNGMGDTVKSWVGTGANSPISGDQISKLLGGAGAGGMLAQLASKFGVSPETINAQLAEHLPQVVDQMTPNGKIEDDQAAA